jgi:hypothetical protein
MGGTCRTHVTQYVHTRMYERYCQDSCQGTILLMLVHLTGWPWHHSLHPTPDTDSERSDHSVSLEKSTAITENYPTCGVT